MIEQGRSPDSVTVAKRLELAQEFRKGLLSRTRSAGYLSERYRTCQTEAGVCRDCAWGTVAALLWGMRSGRLGQIARRFVGCVGSFVFL